jgi:CubicO group peptidase (beta-lactamase class C family)
MTTLFNIKPYNFTPGEKYEYSNSGYVLSAIIIEKVSKMSYRRVYEKVCIRSLKIE